MAPVMLPTAENALFAITVTLLLSIFMTFCTSAGQSIAAQSNVSMSVFAATKFQISGLSVKKSRTPRSIP